MLIPSSPSPSSDRLPPQHHPSQVPQTKNVACFLFLPLQSDGSPLLPRQARAISSWPPATLFFPPPGVLQDERPPRFFGDLFPPTMLGNSTKITSLNQQHDPCSVPRRALFFRSSRSYRPYCSRRCPPFFPLVTRATLDPFFRSERAAFPPSLTLAFSKPLTLHGNCPFFGQRQVHFFFPTTRFLFFSPFSLSSEFVSQ